MVVCKIYFGKKNFVKLKFLEKFRIRLMIWEMH